MGKLYYDINIKEYKAKNRKIPQRSILLTKDIPYSIADEVVITKKKIITELIQTNNNLENLEKADKTKIQTLQQDNNILENQNHKLQLQNEDLNNQIQELKNNMDKDFKTFFLETLAVFNDIAEEQMNSFSLWDRIRRKNVRVKIADVKAIDNENKFKLE